MWAPVRGVHVRHHPGVPNAAWPGLRGNSIVPPRVVKKDSFLWNSSWGVVTSKEPFLCTLDIYAGEFEDSGQAF